MNLKRLTTIILVINLWLFIFGNIVLAYNCPRDDGHGVGCGDATKDILGKSLIVHQGPDDYVTQPSGNSGARVACSAIIR